MAKIVPSYSTNTRNTYLTKEIIKPGVLYKISNEIHIGLDLTFQVVHPGDPRPVAVSITTGRVITEDKFNTYPVEELNEAVTISN